MNRGANGPVATTRRTAKHSDAALRRYLKREKMSQAQFGKMGGWSAPTVSRWLHGEFPTAEQQAVIAKITNGQVEPNSWFQGLPNGRVAALTEDEIRRLTSGEVLKIRLKNGGDVELALARKEP